MPTSRYRFRIGDLFPADNALARWMVILSAGLNDVVLVNGWLLDGLESDAPSRENLYRVRLSSMHVLELATYIKDSGADPDVAAFMATLDPKGQQDLATINGLFSGNPLRSRLEPARHQFAHYVTLDKKVTAKALTTLADKVGELTAGTTGDFQAGYADKVAEKLFFFWVDDLAKDQAALRSFISELSEFTATLMRLTETMIFMYFAKQSLGVVEKVEDGDG